MIDSDTAEAQAALIRELATRLQVPVLEDLDPRGALREATIVVGDPYFFHPDSDRHEKWADYERACSCYEKTKPEPYEVPTDAPLVLRRVGYGDDELGSRTFYEYAGDAQHLVLEFLGPLPVIESSDADEE